MFFFFNDTATTEIYTLSLHDALPISFWRCPRSSLARTWRASWRASAGPDRSEEHTSELQSQSNLVCRLLLEKKKTKTKKLQRKNPNIIINHVSTTRVPTTTALHYPPT